MLILTCSFLASLKVHFFVVFFALFIYLKLILILGLSPEFFKMNFHFSDICNITPYAASLFSGYSKIVLYAWHFETIFELDCTEKSLNVLNSNLADEKLRNMDKFSVVFVCADLFCLCYNIYFIYLSIGIYLVIIFLDSKLAF